MKVHARCLSAIVVLVALSAGVATAIDGEYLLPSGAPRAIVDCKGDGVTDCTEAIRAAIRKTYSAWEVIYLRPGIYMVSDRIDYGRFLILRGAGVGKTVIRLKD